MNERQGDLFGRDGHLTMLSLDRYDAGELGDDERRGLVVHVEDCAHCRARLDVVMHPVAVPQPPQVRRIDHGRNTGSASVAYLVATSAVAMAAAAVLWSGASTWPTRQTAQQQAIEASHNASSYTSVAQEYSDSADVELDVDWGEPTLASPSTAGWLAVVALDDTLGVQGVLAPVRHVDGEVSFGIARRWSAHRVVAVLCPSTFVVEPGQPFAPDASCVTRERDGVR